MKNFMSILVASMICLAPCSCNGQKVDNSTIHPLNLQRYLGDWYEIARFDHSFERGLTHAKANYSLNPDGTLTVRNSGIKKGKLKTAVGKAKFTNTVGRLRVSFFGPFYSDYRIMMLSEDYNYALIGSKNPNYLWILSRTPEVPVDILDQILDEACDRGYNTDRLIWVEQSDAPEQNYQAFNQ